MADSPIFSRATRIMHGVEWEELPPDQWSEYYQLLLEDGVTPIPTDQISLQSLADNFNYPAILKVVYGQSASDDNEV